MTLEDSIYSRPLQSLPSYWAHTYTLTRCHPSSHVEDGCWPVVTAGAQHGQEGLLQSESCFGKTVSWACPCQLFGSSLFGEDKELPLAEWVSPPGADREVEVFKCCPCPAF